MNFSSTAPSANDIPHGALAFASALLGTGYMFPLIKRTETLVGSLSTSARSSRRRLRTAWLNPSRRSSA